MAGNHILSTLGAEMKRRLLAEAREDIWIPPSLENGSGVVALLTYRYGHAGEAEILRAIGLPDTVVLFYYDKVFSDAAIALNLPDARLKTLYEDLQK